MARFYALLSGTLAPQQYICYQLLESILSQQHRWGPGDQEWKEKNVPSISSSYGNYIDCLNIPVSD